MLPKHGMIRLRLLHNRECRFCSWGRGDGPCLLTYRVRHRLVMVRWVLLRLIGRWLDVRRRRLQVKDTFRALVKPPYKDINRPNIGTVAKVLPGLLPTWSYAPSSKQFPGLVGVKKVWITVVVPRILWDRFTLTVGRETTEL